MKLTIFLNFFLKACTTQ